jgi:chemotaxis protein methyltransferase CheR
VRTVTERDDVSALIHWLGERTGLDFDGCHRDRMARTVREALARSGAGGPGAYVQVLEHDIEELEELKDRLTVGETYFMREPAHFELLRATIVPERLAARPGPLRVWSAGCASGEEPYSVAIALDEMDLLDHARIVGTDLSERALDRARAGRYGRWSLRRCGDEERAAWFEADGSRWQLRDRYRDAVQWRLSGLLDGPPAGAFDVALCRNVLIYLTGDAIRAAAAALHDGLNPGGWLLVGASDPPLEHPGLVRVATGHGIVYRRRAHTGAVEPAVAEPAPPQPAAKPAHRRRPRTRSERRPSTPPAARRQSSAPATTAPPGPADDATADAWLRCRAAVGHLEAGRLTEARREAAAAHYLDPTLVGPHLVLAHVCELDGDAEAAVRAYRNAIAVLGDLPPDATVELVDEPARQLMDALIRRLAQLGGQR